MIHCRTTLTNCNRKLQLDDVITYDTLQDKLNPLEPELLLFIEINNSIFVLHICNTRYNWLITNTLLS